MLWNSHKPLSHMLDFLFEALLFQYKKKTARSYIHMLPHRFKSTLSLFVYSYRIDFAIGKKSSRWKNLLSNFDDGFPLRKSVSFHFSVIRFTLLFIHLFKILLDKTATDSLVSHARGIKGNSKKVVAWN